MWLSRPIPLSPWERGNGIETKWTSCPIPLSPWERGKGLAKWNELVVQSLSLLGSGIACETKWTSCPIPLSPRERALELWEGERTSEMKWASCPIPLSPWSEWECSRIEREREGTESDRTIQSLFPWERGRSNCERVKDLAKWNELVVQSLS